MLGAEKLGMTEVPCIFVEDLTEAQKRAYIIADNKLALDAGWDNEILIGELEALKDMNFDISLTGFDSLDEIDLTFGETQEIEEDDFDCTPPEEATAKIGDIYKLGDHRLICGDSTQIETIKNLMGNNFGKADVCVTDPPYNVDYEGKTDEKMKIENDAKEKKEFLEFLTGAFNVMHDALKEGSAFYVWHASRTQREFEDALNDVCLFVRQQLIWTKNSMVLGRQDYQWKHEPCFYGWKDGAPHNWYNDRSQTTVLSFDRPTRNDLHPTMKPLDLIAYQIQNSSKKGDIVIDFFGGSGSTLIACEQLNRRCYMAELDPKYCDVIIKRWEDYTGKKAEKINKE